MKKKIIMKWRNVKMKMNEENDNEWNNEIMKIIMIMKERRKW